MKIKRAILFVIISLSLLGGIVLPAKAAETYSGTNQNKNNYTVWSTTVKSYLAECEDGSLMRFQYIDSEQGMIAEYYNASYQLISTKKIPQELPIFGGFHETDDHYYLVTGQTNMSESSQVEVFRITKYDKNWNRIASTGLYGCNTTIPFDAGSLRMDSEGKYLVIRTSHEMYTSSDGLNHQANVTIQVDTDTMKITDSYTGVMNIRYGYVSHSFNQFIKIDNGKIVSVDHGDAYPRSIVLCKYPNNVSSGTFTSSKVSNAAVLSIYGNTGVNATGASVGGFEIAKDTYLVAGNSVVQNENYLKQKTRNIYVASVNKSTLDVNMNWLTSYEEGDGTTSTPHLVKITDSKFLVLWYRGNDVYYTICDGNGKKTGEIYCMLNASLSDCVPIVKDNKVIWYMWDDEQVTFYEISLDNIVNPKATILEDGNTTQKTFCGDLKHNIVKIARQEPTCTKDGYIEYWGCEICGAPFKDEEGTTALELKEITLGAAHQYEIVSTENGISHLKCGVCGDEKDREVATSFKAYWNESNGDGYYYSVFPDEKEIGDVLYMLVNISPSDVDDEIIVLVSDPSVLNYTSEGSGWGYFTMKKPGTSVITLRSKWNASLSREYTITVYCKEDEHQWDDSFTIEKEATCTEAGRQSIHCQLCSRTKDSEVIQPLGHDWNATLSYDEINHWNECTHCGEKKNLAQHSGGTATFSELAVCSVCGTSYGSLKPIAFTDVKKSDWFYSYVEYVCRNGIMQGTGTGTTFSPYSDTSRAMIVTMLYRLEGSPTVEITDQFTDVAEDSWYAEAVSWALEAGVSEGTGTGTTFSPNNPITREQFATMLYRYAGIKDYTPSIDLKVEYPDGNKVSSWAENGLSWAVEKGLITGKKSGDTLKLAPGEVATRAEAAAIFQRFCENVL